MSTLDGPLVMKPNLFIVETHIWPGAHMSYSLNFLKGVI